MPPDMPVDTVIRQALANLDQSTERLCQFLRIPSVSAQPQRAPDCQRAAEWMRGELQALDFDAALHATAGHPVVLAHHPGPPGYRGPHLLFYGHYDVQPPEPLDLWESPPFEPVVVDGPRGKRIVARGAVDDKGQVMMFVEALRAWHEAGGGIPGRVTVLMEGEEEIGSAHLEPFLRAARDELHADLALISDTGMWDIDTPAITTRLRGLLYTQVTLKGPERDLHSGLFGGSALNPINALTKLLGELTDEGGRVRIPGFYDDVKEIAATEVAQWEALGFDEPAFLGAIGLFAPAGERDRPPLQRLWSRPTADINGIWGGYTGPGSKTVIPTEASAKVSFRLVPDQEPDRIVESFRSFLRSRLPADARVEIEVLSSSRGIATDTAKPWVAAARDALHEEYGRPAVLLGSGGSIPVVELFRRVLGIDSLLVGFGLEDDRMHSPNEKFEMRCFRHGICSHARFLGKLPALA
jgi:acetylornithine deacetylase/succinyl-diaminopimelate desuccinylase-like protein